jgi:phage tail sheath protein FI
MSNNHSDVYLSELDLSAVIANAINSAAAIVFASKQGPVGMQRTTNVKQFIAMYGKPNPQVSYGHYCALAFLQQANSLYPTRAVGAGAVYGGSVLQNLSVNTSSQFNYPLSNPVSFNPASSINGSTSTEQNLAYFFAVGPGSYASNVAVGIASNNLVPLGTVTASLSTTVQELALTNYNLTAPTQVATVSLANQATLTGAVTINSIALTTGQYVLLVAQTIPSQNGVWLVNTSGAWTQSTSTIAFDTSTSHIWTVTAVGSTSWTQYVWTIGGITVQNNDLCLFNGQTTAGQNGVYRYSSTTGTWTFVTTQPPSIVAAGQYLFNLVGSVYVQDFTFAGSTLQASLYTYYVTKVNAAGETLPVMTTITPGTSGNVVELNWTADPLATSYRVYGRVANTIGLLGTTTINSFTDTGLLVPDTTKTYPTTYTGTNTFSVQIYDLTQNSASPVESFAVTLQANVNGLGQQTQMDTVINDATNGSNYIACVNSAASYTTVPLVYSTPKMPLSGGSSGVAVADSDIIAAWQNYVSKTVVSVNMLINGGYSTPAVQTAMDLIARTRQDCTTILDMPSTSQTAAGAVDYRMNKLNLNSNASALYTPDVLITDTYNGNQILVPVSGYVAAQYAYADSNSSPAQAPAGLQYGVLPVNGVRVVYDEADMDLMSANQVNYVRQFPGLGYVIMEAWTLQSEMSALSFVPVRRMINNIEQAVQKALMGSLWSADDPATEDRIVSLITDYLEAKKQAGQIQNYDIESNSTNNPLNDVNQGILHVDTYILPTMPTQRILLRTIITKAGLSFQEAALLAAG